MSIKVSQAFERTSANPIDATFALTKADMLTVNDNLMPNYYFTICQDDGKIYLYDKSATPGAYDINFPNTWPENTEVYFGNGVYGYRAKGNYTSAVAAGSNTATQAALVNLGFSTMPIIINCGGNLTIYHSGISKIINHPANVDRGVVLNDGVYLVYNVASSNQIALSITITSPTESPLSVRTSDTYDVWLTYTK